MIWRTSSSWIFRRPRGGHGWLSSSASTWMVAGGRAAAGRAQARVP
uniref:Uncharacterized protein n=1 Tax=Arundo donax TaxID=35708 RepID=A0A0A9C5G1_ARUDO